MSEGLNIETTKNLLTIRKFFDKAKTPEINKDAPPFLTKPSQPSPDLNEVDLASKPQIPSKDNMKQFLSKESEGINEIVEGVLVQADILSKRNDGNAEARDSFKSLVDRAVGNNVITRNRIEELTELTIQREEDLKNSTLVKESRKVIDEVNAEMSKINITLEMMNNHQTNDGIYLINLSKNRKKLIILSAQIKDRETLVKIDESIDQIDKTIKKVGQMIFRKVDHFNGKLDIESSTYLEVGKYKVSLSLPDIKRTDTKFLYEVEVAKLNKNDEVVKNSQYSEINKKPFVEGDSVVYVNYVDNNELKTKIYHLDEIKYFNSNIKVDDFAKIELDKT